jgi:hypothetical protein
MKILLDKLPEEELLEICRVFILEQLPSWMISNNFSMSLEGWMQSICNDILVYSGIVKAFSHFEDSNGCLNIVFHHELGKRWSKILGAVLSEFLLDQLGINSKCETSSSNIRLTLIEKKFNMSINV